MGQNLVWVYWYSAVRKRGKGSTKMTSTNTKRRTARSNANHESMTHTNGSKQAKKRRAMSKWKFSGQAVYSLKARLRTL
eukprot:6055257-Amphidinium_carterae.1